MIRSDRLGFGVGAAAAALLLAGCVGTAQRDNVADVLPVRIEYPTQPDGFRFVRELRDPDPRIGHQLRYASTTHPELVSDVFVYLNGIFPDHAVAAEALGRDFQSTVMMAVEQGLFTNLEILAGRPFSVRTRYGDNTGSHIRMALVRDGEAQISHAHLFYLPPYTVKFRSSFPASGNRSFDEALHALVEGFMAELAVDEDIRCHRAVTVWALAPEARGWVSLDGVDIMLPGAAPQDVLDQLLIESRRRRAAWNCESSPASAADEN